MKLVLIIISILSATQVFAGKPCAEVTECKGALPRHCVACTNGKGGGCAHWSCVKGQCAIMTCDLDKPTKEKKETPGHD